jgi:hypothetical protein
MQFFTTIASAALALATLASCTNTVLFINQDNFTKNVVFTSQADLGLAPMPNLIIPGFGSANQTFAAGFIGNWYSFNDGSDNVPGMLGEVSFNSWEELNFFDVSAIVNPDDDAGVKMLFPMGMSLKEATTPRSGCNTVGKVKCLHQYNAWDDIATQSTLSTELVCLLGNKNTTDDDTKTRRGQSSRRSVELFPRSYVTGPIASAEA